MSLRQAFSSPGAKRRHVRHLFATIASRYDLATVLLSYGQDRRWKRRLAEEAGVAPGVRTLDLACGTGDIAFEVARRGARVVGLDVTPGMLRLAAARQGRPGAVFVQGDMMDLPFPSASFDLVTIGYGLRNVPEIEAAVCEIGRVLRPGGRVASLDFDRPANRAFRGAYLAYLTAAGSALGLLLHGNPETYRYIPESIRRYPGAAAVARLFAQHGFLETRVVPLLGGLMALNLAVRGADDGRASGTVR